MEKEKVKEIIISYLDSLKDGTIINFISITHYDENDKSCNFRIDYDN